MTEPLYDPSEVQTVQLRHGLTAVLVPTSMTLAEENALRLRLGLPCRHSRKKPTR
jgi:hypothetical protein